MTQQPNTTPFSTTPAVYASFSQEAQALLEGLIIVAEDPELQTLASEPLELPLLLRFPMRRSA